jgi:cytochrome c oxidase subunit IV
MSSHVVPFKTYFMVFLALLLLLALTTGMAYVDLGGFNTVIALAIAFVKMLLVMLFFMHLRQSSALMRTVVVAGFFWLAILIGLTYSDYSTRTWIQPPQSWSNSAPATHP